MTLNELRSMVKAALREDSRRSPGLRREWVGPRPASYEPYRITAPFEEPDPEQEQEETNLSFADDDEDDRPAEGVRSIADVRKEIHDLMGSAMETLKVPTEKHQKRYGELMAQLLGLNQELENLANTKEKQQQ